MLHNFDSCVEYRLHDGVTDHKTIFAKFKFDSKRSPLLLPVEKYYSEFSKKRANLNLKTQDIIAAGQQDIFNHSQLKTSDSTNRAL